MPQHTRASLPHAALYTMSINRVKKSVHSVRIIGVLRDEAHVLQNASATFSPLPFQHLHLYMLYPSLPSPSHCQPYPAILSPSHSLALRISHHQMSNILHLSTSTVLAYSLFSTHTTPSSSLNLQLCRSSSQFHQPPPPPLTLHHHTTTLTFLLHQTTYPF